MHGIVERGRCVRIRSRDSSGLWPGCFHQREVSTEQSSIVVACRTTQLSWNLSIWQFPLIWIINNIYVRFWSWKSNYCKIRRCPNRLDSPFFRYGLKFAIVTHEGMRISFLDNCTTAYTIVTYLNKIVKSSKYREKSNQGRNYNIVGFSVNSWLFYITLLRAGIWLHRKKFYLLDLSKEIPCRNGKMPSCCFRKGLWSHFSKLTLGLSTKHRNA